MARFGDVAWAVHSGGHVRGMARGRQVLAAIRFQLGQRLRRRPRAIGAASAGEVDRMLAEIELPDTPLVARATALITELGPAPLAGHALRTWAWGALLALRDGLRFDRETFALAALLHDLALAQRTAAVTCFAADGAAQATAVLAAWGAVEPVRAIVADAICLHVRVEVPAAYGVEAHLVHAGAGVDVVGARLREIVLEIRRRVLARYPRGELKAMLVDAFAREQREHPSSRMALWAGMGFLNRIAAAPFEEP